MIMDDNAACEQDMMMMLKMKEMAIHEHDDADVKTMKAMMMP